MVMTCDEVRDQHRGAVDDGGAGQLGLVPQLDGDPAAGEAEDRLGGGRPGQRLEAVAEGEHAAGGRLAAGDLDAGDPDRVGGDGQVDAVAGAHRRHDDAEVEGDLAAQGADAVEQVAAGGGVDEVDQVGGEHDLERVDPHLRAQRLGGVGVDGAGRPPSPADSAVLLGGPSSPTRWPSRSTPAPTRMNGSFGMPGTSARAMRRGAGDHQRRLAAAELLGGVGAHVALGGGAGDDEAGGDRHQQRRDLGDQAVADRQQAVGLQRLGRRHPLLQHADREAADQVDDGDDDAGDRVALDELRATVHRAVEVRLGADVRAALARLVLVDEAGVEVGVDRHLLAGHRVEGEPRADLGDAARTVGDDDELDDDQDQEDHQADDERAADDEVAEGVDHLAGEAVRQHQPGRGHVEAEPEQGEDQQQRGEDREVERAAHVHRREQDDQGADDVQRDQQVEQRGRDRHHEQQDDAHDADGDGERGDAGAASGGSRRGGVRGHQGHAGSSPSGSSDREASSIRLGRGAPVVRWPVPGPLVCAVLALGASAVGRWHL